MDDGVLVVDCPPGAPGPRMRVAGMTVLERHLRDGARRGHTRAVVRAAAGDVPPLPPLPIDVSFAPPDAPAPPDAEVVRGDELLGVRLDGERARRAVEWALLQTCRRPYDGPGDRHVIRPISLRITRALSRTAITPNQVTAVALALGLAAAALAAAGGRAATAVAGALMLAQVVLDSVDGELSRVRHMGSQLGMWLDNLSDDLVDNLIVAALGAGLGGPWVAVGAAAALARGFSAWVTYRGARNVGRPGDVMAFRWWFEDGDTPEQAYGATRGPLEAARALGRRDTYMLVFGAACMAGVPQIAFALGVANSVAYFALAAIHLIRRRGRA
ncbi:MAG: CDP-alcohol phosphatidyltransferase family protein [Deltaproteobacteria bacterium]|nr:MAG: CDP-alcohol phosphatidyltransferase family protein [Deltaproteobacteria bacterium]